MIQGNDFSIIASTAHGPKPPRDTYTIRFKTELERLTALRLEALTFDELPKGGPGRDSAGGFVVSEVEVEDRSGRPLALRHATARRTPRPLATRPQPPSTGARARAAGALAAADGESHRLVVELAAPIVREGDTTTLTLVMRRRRGGALRTLGRLRLAGSSDETPVRTAPGLEPGPDLVAAAGLAPQPSKDQQTALARFYRREAPELSARRCARPSSSARRSWKA